MENGRWSPNNIRMYTLWNYPYPKFNKNLTCNRSKEEIESIVSRYFAKNKSRSKKQFITMKALPGDNKAFQVEQRARDEFPDFVHF